MSISNDMFNGRTRCRIHPTALAVGFLRRVSVKGDKRVDLKEFRKTHGLRNLSFASSDDLLNILCLIPRAVTPLGLLNDEERKVIFYFDAAFLGGLAGVHPNDNTATVWLKAEDLMRLIEEHGNTVHTVAIGG